MKGEVGAKWLEVSLKLHQEWRHRSVSARSGLMFSRISYPIRSG